MIRFNDYSDGYAIANETSPFNPTKDVVIARVESGELLGGVIFQGYTGASIQIHVAGFHPQWINRDMLWITFHYPFVQLKCKRLVGLVPSSNQKAIAFNTKLGFKEEARVKEIYPSGDLIIMTMTKDDARRWLAIKPVGLRAKNGQEE